MDARTGRTVDPPALVSDEKIEMTPWELQSFAVQVVRDPLADAGRSLWFVGESGPEWGAQRATSPAKPCFPPTLAKDGREPQRSGQHTTHSVAKLVLTVAGSVFSRSTVEPSLPKKEDEPCHSPSL